MALRAIDRRAHPDGHGRIDAIDDGDIAELLVVGAALVIRQSVAMEGRRDQLLLGRLGQQIAGNLFERELVERFVRVEGLDDVIAIQPDRPGRVVRVAGRVRVARQVQPQPRPMFAVAGLCQQPVHELFVGLRIPILDKIVYLLEARRQASEVKGNTANEGIAIGPGRRLQPFALQPGEEEVIDGVFRPG